ncbi:exonuclease domain-containing protein [Portibacter lacus]|uniref:Exonuclease domain-containing protein n=1 Tax=Portibacter lacus TaxID=1099794 RepID=A0AA37WG52_9BACT|nr:exonuclease domain-containing protein [Portibacter lacus]GLR19377.1 hypothetical protein GCM10007940_39930 [Portibacter lacus]
MYLLFDTTANGKVKSWKASYTDVFSWPRMMHCSWIVLDDAFKPIEDFNCFIKPDGYNLSEEAIELSGEDKAKFENGDPIKEVLEKFKESLEKVQYTISFNLNFNENIIAAEYHRQGEKNPLLFVDKFCLMQESTWYCKIPGRNGNYKWPSLNELHATCFNQKYSPAGNARADVIAASRSFIKLMKLGQLEDMFED